MALVRVKKTRQTENLPPQESDQGSVDLVRALLLDPVTGPIENELLPQIRQHALYLVDQLCADQSGNDAILRSRNEQRRLVDLRALPRRGQFPIAVDVTIPVQPAAEAGVLVDSREIGDVSFGQPIRQRPIRIGAGEESL